MVSAFVMWLLISAQILCVGGSLTVLYVTLCPLTFWVPDAGSSPCVLHFYLQSSSWMPLPAYALICEIHSPQPAGKAELSGGHQL